VKIAFFGLPLAAILLARDGHTIVWAGVCRKGALGTRRLRALVENVEIVPDANSGAVRERIRRAAPDLMVSWFWTKRLPRQVLSIAPLGAVGVHPSLLPRHRGPDPYFWAIRAGDAVTGVTAHVLDDAYDTGAMLGHKELAIDPSWSAWTLAKRLDRPSLALLREVVRAYASGRPPQPIAQDDASATLAPAPDDDELAIDWRQPAEAIARLVRAASPWPGATFTLGDEVLVLEVARVTDAFPRALEPGEAAIRSDGVVVVRAGDHALELVLGRDESDAPIRAKDWARRVRALL
jgi:methionyl-tRNA formyltransferase